MANIDNVGKTNEIKTEDDYDEEESYSSSSSSNDRDKLDAKKTMMRFMFIVIGVVVFIAIVLLLASIFMKPNYTYDDLEDILKNAAVAYFKDNKDQLPQAEGGIVEIEAANLINAEYMKPFTEYAGEENNCNGVVRVEKTSSSFLYTPYLTCGEDYVTTELASVVTSSDNLTSSGYGLYSLNGAYIFRGEEVNNYLEMDERLWRIFKIDRNNNIYLVAQDEVGMTTDWDDRYNEDASYAAGINNYGSSRIKEYLQQVYTDPDRDNREGILSKKDKTKIVSFNLCTGKRTTTEEGNNNSIECKETTRNQQVGLLTLSDYMAASIDPNCKNSTSNSCSNYNYLVTGYEFWLATANKASNFEAFQVKTNGAIKSENTSTYAIARAVVVLNKNVLYKSGKGTEKSPYKIK